ncbi:flagellar protein FliT [Azoarcus taiwanensis]|nr:flagellar protein FliT [Azoarcus taiwanensis]
MLVAAQANDLDTMSTLERRIIALRHAATDSRENREWSQTEVEEMRKQIARMLELHTQILEHLGPLLDETRKLLGGSAKDRAVRSAYSALGPP